MINEIWLYWFEIKDEDEDYEDELFSGADPLNEVHLFERHYTGYLNKFFPIFSVHITFYIADQSG